MTVACSAENLVDELADGSVELTADHSAVVWVVQWADLSAVSLADLMVVYSAASTVERMAAWLVVTSAVEMAARRVGHWETSSVDRKAERWDLQMVGHLVAPLAAPMVDKKEWTSVANLVASMVVL